MVRPAPVRQLTQGILGEPEQAQPDHRPAREVRMSFFSASRAESHIPEWLLKQKVKKVFNRWLKCDRCVGIPTSIFSHGLVLRLIVNSLGTR